MKLCVLLVSASLFLSANSHRKTIVYATTVLPTVEITFGYGGIPLKDIKDVIAKRESNNNYYVVNQLGCMGKYQFTRNTLKMLKFDPDDFLYKPKVQELAMNALIEYNHNYLQKHNLLKYVGKKVGGIMITEAGLLAAMHLLGGASVKDYLRSNGSMREYWHTYKSGRTVFIRKYDANKTSIKEYLKLFEHGNKL